MPWLSDGLFFIPFSAVAVLIVGALVFQAGRGLSRWLENNAQPSREVLARVVGKRTDTRSWNSRNRVSTDYFATFELASGERLEFDMDGETYGLLAEGDEGQLSHQGTRYHGFRRT